VGLFDWRKKRSGERDAEHADDEPLAPDGVSPLYASLSSAPRGAAEPPSHPPYSETYSVTVTPAPARPAGLLGAHEASAAEAVDAIADAEEVPPSAPSQPPPVSSEPRAAAGPLVSHAHARPHSSTDGASSSTASRPHPQHAAHALMRAAFDAADWDRALSLGRHILARDPYDGEARACTEACAAHLLTDFTARLGRRERVLRRLAADEWLEGVVIDQRAARLLEEIDGQRSIEDVMARAGLPPLEAMGLLLDMLAEGVLEAVPRVR
jgi:hypothetical protein